MVEGFGEEVVVNGKTELVISPVIYLILSERDVAHGEVIEVFSVRCLKARDGNVRLGIKLLGNTSGDAVQLHAVELAALHLLRQQTKKVANAHRRLQNVTALEAHIADRFIDRLDDGGAGVVGVQRGRSGRSVFLRGECGVQLCQADWDRRYSPNNRAWANAMSIPANPDAWGTDRNCYLAVSSHPGLVDLFLSQTRKAYAQERQKTSVRDKLKTPPETTSPKISAKSKAPER